ncbi:MAG: hypothetical protein WC679_00565 [Bacteroidales bacterium]|jgi:hypothetical protein
MKAILIKQCLRGQWYGEFINCIVPFAKVVHNPVAYKSREFAGFTNFVEPEDSILIDVPDDFDITNYYKEISEDQKYRLVKDASLGVFYDYEIKQIASELGLSDIAYQVMNKGVVTIERQDLGFLLAYAYQLGQNNMRP